MTYEWKFSTQDLDWKELSELYRIAPLGGKDPSDLQVAFSNSMFMCFVYDSGRLIAAGRALADGRDCSYICDVAVHPDHQGRGLGKEVVMKLVDLSKDHNKIILYAAAGKDLFYKKLGFKRLKTAMAIFKNEAQALANGVLADS